MVTIGSLTSRTNTKFNGIISGQHKYYNWSITSDQVMIPSVTLTY